MPLAGFEVAVDEHGRSPLVLEPSGGTLTVATSGTANGGWLPGDRRELAEEIQMIRVTATKDCYIAFNADVTAAVDTDILFIAGTEQMKLPYGKPYVSALCVTGTETGKLSVTVLQ